MKIKILLWTLLCVVLSACRSQSGQMGHANDTENGRVFAVEDFDEVDINCDAKVTVNFVQDSRCEVTAKAAESVLDDMGVTVRNGELIVSNQFNQSFDALNSSIIRLVDGECDEPQEIDYIYMVEDHGEDGAKEIKEKYPEGTWK